MKRFRTQDLNHQSTRKAVISFKGLSSLSNQLASNGLLNHNKQIQDKNNHIGIYVRKEVINVSMHDVIIIGAGPVGLAAGITAKRAGLDYIIIEKGVLVNSIYNFPTFMTWFSYNYELSIAGIPFTINPTRPTREQTLSYYNAVTRSQDLKIILDQEVIDINGKDEMFIVLAKKKNGSYERYNTKKVIVATGYFGNPNMLEIPGEKNVAICSHYYIDNHPYVTKKVIIVGAGNSAVETALDLYRAGAAVTLVHRGPSIKPKVKYWLKPDIEGRIEDGSINALFNTKVTAIQEGKVIVEKNGNTMELEADYTFLLTGYHPDYKFLEKIDLELNEEGEVTYNPETCETNRPGVYTIGSCANGMFLTKVFIKHGRNQAFRAINDIKSKLGA